ncbi:MAG: D-alanyl-D-alanine carboxypeptidase [Ruminococcaceae bacterium]|nr:D-alanyl-D-alanine carboxypeptidase [Oscillospiraceae bacterium]
MKKFLLLIVAFLLLVCSVIPLFSTVTCAEDIGLPEPPKTEGVDAIYFYNITSDKILKAENDNTPLATSTSAKVMMGLLACENFENKLQQQVQITGEMLVGINGSNISGLKYDLKAGDKVLVSDLLYLAICGSYNDAAYVIAYLVGGSAENFVAMMNRRAHELGATKTHYTNPIGYPNNESMVTTASDTAKIALAAYKNSLYMEICSENMYTLSTSETVYNRNYLISSHHDRLYGGKYYNEHCFGMNAGQSQSVGGWSLITVASHSDQKYLCVILGGHEDENNIFAYAAANKLVKWAVAEYQTHTIYKKGTELGLIEIGLTGMAKNQGAYVTAQDLKVYLPKNIQYSENLLTRKIELSSQKVDAPVSAGHKVGEVKIYYNGDCVGKCDLVLADDYTQNPILAAVNKISEYTHSRAFLITAIVAVISLPTALIIIKHKNRKGSHRKYK